MADADKNAKVVNKSGTLKMTDETAATRARKDINGKAMPRRNGRRDRNRNMDTTPKEFDTVTINIVIQEPGQGKLVIIPASLCKLI